MKFIPLAPARLTIALFLLCGTVSAFADEVFTLKWQGSGMREKMRGYRPHFLPLTAEAPVGIKKLPDGIVSPKFASFKIGPAAAPATITLILEKKDGKPAHLYVDSAGKGDLTADAAHDWVEHKAKTPDGSEMVSYSSEATVQIPFVTGARPATVKFYCMDKMGEQIAYYSDFGFVGEVKIGDRTIPIMLDDSGCAGDMHISDNVMNTPLVWLDLNGDGKPSRGEVFIAGKPFEVDGKWWAMANLTPEGTFQIVASAKPLPPKHDGPDLSPGQKAPAFTATLSDGKQVKFPDDYKGKLVLIDFWATWCGPCVAEIPNVVKNYDKRHEAGFDVLGISLDQANAAEKITKFTADKHMPWPQVYDGQGWKAAVARLYGIDAIPHMILVNGDTGMIVADNNIRGDELEPAIEKGLAGMKKQ